MARTEQAARGLLLALFAATVYLLFLVFQPFLPGIAWAVFLVTAFYPVHVRILRVVRGREWPAAVLTTCLVAALIVAPVSILVSTLAKNVATVLPAIEEQLRKGAAPDAADEAVADTPAVSVPVSAPAETPDALSLFEKAEEFLSGYVDVSGFDLKGTALGALKGIGQGLLAQTTPLLQNILRTFLQIGVAIATMVVLFKEGSAVVTSFRRFLPLREKDKDAVFDRLHVVSRAVFYGVIMTALIQGILGGIGWAIVGLPAAAAFGIAMFFCALIPAGGTAIIWGPGALFLFYQGHPVKAVVLALWGALVVGLIDNLLKPIFISGRTRMHMLLVFFGIVGGIMAFGFTGLFLGPLVITLFLSLIEVIRRDFFVLDAVAEADTGRGSGPGSGPAGGSESGS